MSGRSKHAHGRTGTALGAALSAGTLGILLVLFVVLAVAGCGGNDSYKSDATAIVSDLQTVTDASVALLERAALEQTESTGTDPQAGLEQAEAIRDQSAQWAASVVEALAGFRGLTPPENAVSLHNDYTSFLEAYGVAVDKLSTIAGYAADVLSASSGLRAATAEDGVLGQLGALVDTSSADLEAEVALLDSGYGVIEDFLTQWESISSPEDFADIHSTIGTDLNTALLALESALGEARAAVGSGSGEGAVAFQSLVAEFSAQWAMVQQDFEGWSAVHASLTSSWLADMQELLQQQGELRASLEAL